MSRTRHAIPVLALTLALGVAPVAMAAPTAGAASMRSFPAMTGVRHDPTRESVSTTSDGTWGGVENLDIPVTESSAEREARIRAEEQRRVARSQTTASTPATRSDTRTPLKTPDTPAGRSGQSVADYATQYAGYPYVYGGNQPTGWDCSGFVQYIYSQFGISLPHSSGAQMNAGTPVASLEDAQPGDILANPNHAAVYLGNGMVMNAMSPAQGTGIAPVATVMGSSYAIRRMF